MEPSKPLDFPDSYDPAGSLYGQLMQELPYSRMRPTRTRTQQLSHTTCNPPPPSVPCSGGWDNGARPRKAGMAGIMIEDQIAPKRCGHTKGKSVVGREEAYSRVRAACDARYMTAYARAVAFLKRRTVRWLTAPSPPLTLDGHSSRTAIKGIRQATYRTKLVC